MKRIALYFVSTALILVSASCEKFLDVKPDGSLTTDEVIVNADSLQMFLKGAYSSVGDFANGNFQTINELLSDNLSRPNTNLDYREIYTFNTLFFNGTIGGTYGNIYRAAMRANFVIENFDLADDLTEAEARFIRALAHFEIVRLFAHPWGYTSDNSHPGIVIRTTVDFEIAPRNTVREVYEDLIIPDLIFAKENSPASNGNYATSFAAQALLAKVYFQQNRLGDAANEAAPVIQAFPFDTSVAGLDRFVFGDTSTVVSEFIFRIVSTEINNTVDNRGGTFTGNYRSDNNPNPELRTNKTFLNPYSSNADDRRVLRFFQIRNDGAPNEFVAISKFDKDFISVPYLHTTSMKLLLAECLAGSDPATAVDHLNDIRRRAYGSNAYDLPASSTPTEIREAIEF
ncbi:MAG: RagB/SusD family nutrient uptake outer membrane protein [Flavobacteriales bacterium]|nr:RagB/SusD family nutrient uptake outer membrane protein [Flavobacteriales bacterium]